MWIPGGSPETVGVFPVLVLFALGVDSGIVNARIVGRPEPCGLPCGVAENSPRRFPAGGDTGSAGATGFTLRAIIRPVVVVPVLETEGDGGTAPAEMACPALPFAV